MGTRSALLLALIGAETVGEAATAAFVNVIAEEFRGDGWIEHGYEGLTTYRVYAVFDDIGKPGLLSVYAIPESPARGACSGRSAATSARHPPSSACPSP